MRRRGHAAVCVQALSQCRGIGRRCGRVAGQLEGKAGARRRRRPDLGDAALYWFCGFVMGYLAAAVLAAPVWAGR